MQTVTIDITAAGETTVKVQGCPGPSCKQLTAAIEAAIGSTKSDQLTPEFRQSAGQTQQTQQREQRA